MAVSIVLAWLVYRLIEKPTQARRGFFVPVILSILVMCISVAGLGIYQQDGLSFRAANKGSNVYLASRQTNAEIRARYKADHCDDINNLSKRTYRFCKSYGPKDKDTIVLWGDSHMDAWEPVFFEIAKENNLRVIKFSHHGCPPLVGIRRTDIGAITQDCTSLGAGEDIVKAIQAIKPKHIFIVARWSLYEKGLRIEGNLHPATHFITTDPIESADIDSSRSALQSQLFTTLQLLTKDFPVTIFRTMPTLKTNIEKGLIRGLPVEQAITEHKRFEAFSDRIIDQSLNQLSNLDVFDPSILLCDQSCHAIINGIVYYLDDNHVSAQGTLQFRELLVQKYFGSVAHRVPATLTTHNPIHKEVSAPDSAVGRKLAIGAKQASCEVDWNC